MELLQITKESVVVEHQTKTFRRVVGKVLVEATIGWDDKCHNGHNDFSVTGVIYKRQRNSEPPLVYGGKRWWPVAFGCLHDEIAQAFPKLKKYIKWHLCSSDGPMYYIGNTTHHAGDRDYNGHKKGDACDHEIVLYFDTCPISFHKNDKFLQWFVNQSPETLVVEEVKHEEAGVKGKYQFNSRYTYQGYVGEWYECPFGTREEAEEWKAMAMFHKPYCKRIPTAWSEGKERNLDAARRIAVWPDATDEELCQEKPLLIRALVERLPKLLEEFRHDVEELGFVW